MSLTGERKLTHVHGDIPIIKISRLTLSGSETLLILLNTAVPDTFALHDLMGAENVFTISYPMIRRTMHSKILGHTNCHTFKS